MGLAPLGAVCYNVLHQYRGPILYSLEGRSMAVAARVLVRYRRDGGPWYEYPFDQGELVLGRAPGCDLRLDDPDVSRQHARLTIASDGL